MGHASYLPLVTACLALGLGLGGCSSGNGSSSGHDTSDDGTLRLANATTDGTLALYATGVTDDDVQFSITGVAAGGVSARKSADAQSYTVGVSEAAGKLIGASDTVWLSADTDYTLLAFERLGSVDTYAITDGQVTPSTGFASLVVANAAGDAGSLDVYLVAPNQALNGVSPAYASVSSSTATMAKSITAGTYDVVVTAAGKPSDRRLTVGSAAVASGTMLTLALTPTLGGGLVGGALLDQEGAMTTYPPTTARVRVVGAFAAGASSNSTVKVTVGATTLPTVTAPTAGSYALVPGDTSSYTVAVDGIDVASLPATTFENGGDYTVMAYGTASAPTVAVYADANQPASSGSANVRLVNGAVAGGLTLTADYVPIDADVEYGATSAYAPATPTTAALLQITSPVAAFPTYSASDVRVLANAVYTVFVLGSTSAPIVVLAKDR